MLPRKIFIVDEYAKRISDVCGVPIEYIIKLRDMGVIHPKGARDVLIQHDFEKLKAMNKLTSAQILEKLGSIHNLKRGQIYEILRTRQRTRYYCIKCGNSINQKTFISNAGLCDKCVADKILIKI